jgi:hypothetical protein
VGDGSSLTLYDRLATGVLNINGGSTALKSDDGVRARQRQQSCRA